MTPSTVTTLPLNYAEVTRAATLSDAAHVSPIAAPDSETMMASAVQDPASTTAPPPEDNHRPTLQEGVDARMDIDPRVVPTAAFLPDTGAAEEIHPHSDTETHVRKQRSTRKHKRRRRAPSDDCLQRSSDMDCGNSDDGTGATEAAVTSNSTDRRGDGFSPSDPTEQQDHKQTAAADSQPEEPMDSAPSAAAATNCHQQPMAASAAADVGAGPSINNGAAPAAPTPSRARYTLLPAPVGAVTDADMAAAASAPGRVCVGRLPSGRLPLTCEPSALGREAVHSFKVVAEAVTLPAGLLVSVRRRHAALSYAEASFAARGQHSTIEKPLEATV
ncbi:zinc finger CCCH domain-containing protein 18-like [Schistocerca cancellata]|uniref:zinc finger CCCH domain-containing protein 18-like n=1 Tax=Schistocerca cancellata TaxID=274614 RepID=UPI002118F7CC|nr:zinc finger CCCH domain-containing protein 18-like [Schistocerca cancellata]